MSDEAPGPQGRSPGRLRRRGVEVLLVVLAVASCAAPAPNMHGVRAGDSTSQVIDSLGTPDVDRGSVRNRFDQVVDVYEYRLSSLPDGSSGGVVGTVAFFTGGTAGSASSAESENYWLYFIDDGLTTWREAGDWEHERARLIEIRFPER